MSAGPLVFTAWVVVLLLLTVPPLWVALLIFPAGRWPDRVLKGCIRLVLRVSGCRLHVSGAEWLRACGSVMLVANHASYLDSIVLMAVLPIDCRFVANHELKAVPVIGTAIRKIGHLTVDRSARRDQHACLRAMIDALEHGMSILVFPEATISPGLQLLPFRAGAFRAATETGRPVVAISLRGTREIWPYRSWMMHQGAIDVRIHEPIQPVERGRKEAARLRDWARGEIASGLDA